MNSIKKQIVLGLQQKLNSDKVSVDQCNVFFYLLLMIIQFKECNNRSFRLSINEAKITIVLRLN